MKKWKLIVLISSIIVVIGISLTLVLIFVLGPNSNEAKYPTKEPNISDKDGTFLKIGERIITNEDAFNRGLVSYGLQNINDLVDNILLDDTWTEEELEEHRKLVYARYNNISIDEVTYSEEQDKKFKDQMMLSGYFTDEDILNAIKLDLKRTKYAKNILLDEIKNFQKTESNPYYFTTSEVTNAINSISEANQQVKALYIVFRSENEAKTLMKKLGIDTNNLVNGWKHLDGSSFTKKEVLDTFIQMYNIINNKNITIDEIEYVTSKEISSISSTVASCIFNTLSDMSTDNKYYLSNPNQYYLTNYNYLAIKIETKNIVTSEEVLKALDDETLRTDLIKDIINTLIDNKLTSNYINTLLYKNRIDADILIYNERLDIDFYQNALNAVGTTSDKTYQKTTDESDEYLVRVTKNGEYKYITCDELFELIKARHSSILAVEYLNYYILFSNKYSDVYNFETKTKLSNYNVSYNKNIYDLETQLSEGALDSLGFYKNYGWNNFVKDYFGFKDPLDVIVLGDANQQAVKKYTTSFFSVTTDTANQVYSEFKKAYVSGEISIQEYENYLSTLNKEDYENTLVYQIIKDYINYYHVKAVMLNVFFDKDYNGIADSDIDEESFNKAKDLLKAFYYLAENNPKTISYDSFEKKILEAITSNKYKPHSSITGSTVEERLAKLILIYNIAPLDDEIFGEYKKMGLRINKTSETTYTNESLDTSIALDFTELWHDVALGNKIIHNGQNIHFEFANVVNPETTALSAIGIDASKPYRINDFYEHDNIYSIVFVTELINTSWYQYYQKEDAMNNINTVKELIPSLNSTSDELRLAVLMKYYELSLINAEDRTAEQTKEFANKQPMSHEIPFVNNVLANAYDGLYNSEIQDDALFNIRKNLILDGTCYFTDNTLKENCLKVMEVAYQE